MFTKKNGGLSDARNAGIKVSTGEFIFFLDSDDYLDKNYFNQTIKNDADLTISNYCAFYEDKRPNIYGKLYLEKYDSLNSFLLDFNKYFATIFNFAWGKLYKGNVIRDNGILFRLDVSMVEDVLFNLEYYKFCKNIYTCNNVCVNYRQTQGTLSKIISPKTFDWYLLSYNLIKEFLIQNGAFTIENQSHLYSHFIGNVLECLLGFYKYSDSTRKEKYLQIVECDFVQTALSYYKNKKIKGIIRALKSKRIDRLERQIKFYLFLLNTKKHLRSLYARLFKNQKRV